MADKPASTAEEILSSIGDISGIEIFHNQLLVAVHVGSGVTKGGLILPDKTRDEDKWQGKVGLVLKKGPLCFRNDARNDFAGQDVQIGDWVMFKVNETSSIQINKMHCRLMEDIHVRGVVKNPEMIW